MKGAKMPLAVACSVRCQIRMGHTDNWRKQIHNNEFLQGIIWNYGSLIILSISGFLFNCLILYFYDTTALGVFNRGYAWYLVLSQISVWGIHMSVLKLTPEYKTDIQKCEEMLNDALIGVLIHSVVVVCVTEAILPLLVSGHEDLLKSLQIVVPGLVFFSLNKVMLNYINGLSEMKAYAFFQSLRYIVIVFTIFVLGVLSCDSNWLLFSFVQAEIVTFLLSVGYLLYKGLIGKHISFKYLRQHIQFGTHILPANMVIELNTKVDIICLGFVLQDDYLIGIYSFSIMFVEGFYQLYITVRRSINPKITECYVRNDSMRGIEEINRNLKKYLRVFSPLALVLILIGYYVICRLLNQNDYTMGLGILLMVCSAIVLNGRSIIFGNILSQMGRPGAESIINTVTVVSNFVFNLILILGLGLWGAALATAISHFVFGITLRYSAKKELQIIL